LELAKSAVGSRVLDAFLDSLSIPTEKKKRFIKKFKGLIAELAEDKYGGFFVQKCYKFGDVKQKEFIAEELATIGEKVSI